jgi:hypothetical protein
VFLILRKDVMRCLPLRVPTRGSYTLVSCIDALKENGLTSQGILDVYKPLPRAPIAAAYGAHQETVMC